MIEPSFHSRAELFERTGRHPWVTLTPDSPPSRSPRACRAGGWAGRSPRRSPGGCCARRALVGLGVLTSNERAIRLYRRLGFTDGIELTSIRLAG
jgi:hypothetical protein